MKRFVASLIFLLLGATLAKAQWTTPVKNWTTPVQMSRPVEESTQVQQSRPVKLTRKEVKLSKAVEQSESVQVSTWTELSKPVTFTRLVELSKQVELSKPIELSKSTELSTPVELSKSVEFTHYVDFSRSIILSRAVTLSKQVDLSTSVEMSKLVELSKSVDLSKTVKLSDVAELSTLVNLSNITDLSTVVAEAKQKYLRASGMSDQGSTTSDFTTTSNLVTQSYAYLSSAVSKSIKYFAGNFDAAYKMWSDLYSKSNDAGHPNYFYLYEANASSLFTKENAPKTKSVLALIGVDPSSFGDIIPGSGGLSKIVQDAKSLGSETVESVKLYSDATFNAFKTQLEQHGIESLLKSKASLEQQIEDHVQKLTEIEESGEGYVSSVEREIATFQSQVAAIEDLIAPAL